MGSFFIFLLCCSCGVLICFKYKLKKKCEKKVEIKKEEIENHHHHQKKSHRSRFNRIPV